MVTRKKTEVFLNDFIISVSLPSVKVTEEELIGFLSSPVKLEVQQLFEFQGKTETFVRFPNLFGEQIGKVWFRGSIVKEISNKQLQILDYILNLSEDDPRAYDEFGPDTIVVLDLNDDSKTFLSCIGSQTLGVVLPR